MLRDIVEDLPKEEAEITFFVESILLNFTKKKLIHFRNLTIMLLFLPKLVETKVTCGVTKKDPICEALE